MTGIIVLQSVLQSVLKLFITTIFFGEIIMSGNTAPDLTKPLVSEPMQTSPAAPTTDLGPLQHLVGTLD